MLALLAVALPFYLWAARDSEGAPSRLPDDCAAAHS
jgi:hypothetical protein